MKVNGQCLVVMSQGDRRVVDSLWSERWLVHLQVLLEGLYKYLVISRFQRKLILVVVALDNKNYISCIPALHVHQHVTGEA